MEAFSSPLVLTKLRVPAARPRNLTRARLVDLLTFKNSADFLLVCAPAGYGKTTLLVEWAQSLVGNGVAVAWYALDPSDDEPIPFGSYLVATIIQAFGPISELLQQAQLLRSSPEIDLQRIMAAVINSVVSSDREGVLILDDYHLITSPAVHSAIAYLIDHLPENLRIAIGSRSDPPLLLARLRARGRLLEIRAGDLRFTADEAAHFLNEVMRLDLSPGGVAALEERTEGWVAGLQMAGLSLSGRADKERFIASFTGIHRYLVDYLLEEVFNRQSEEVQSFLLFTSILERMCAPLCQAVLDTPSFNDEILLQLEKANLFIVALDDQGKWYRYHHLFRDFLQTRLNKAEPQRITSLHRAACDWLAAHEFLREAARHAFQTQDWEYAAAFVEQHTFTLLIHSEISTIYEWCSAFPEDVMRAHPRLCIHQCWAWVFRFQRQYRGRVEERLHQAGQAADRLEDQRLVRELKEEIAVIRTFLAMAPDPTVDPQVLLALTQNMLGYYPEGNAGQFSALLTIGYCQLALQDVRAAAETLETARQIALSAHLYFGVVESTFHLARLAHVQGQLSRAEQICRQSQSDIASMLAHPEQELPAIGCLDIALGCISLEQDRLEDAERRLLNGLELIGWGTNPNYLMTGYMALFRLYEIQSRSTDALKYLDRLEAAWPDIAFCTNGYRIIHTLRSSPKNPAALAEALAWCRIFPMSMVYAPGMGPLGAAEVYYLAGLAWVRIQIALGNSKAALAYLDHQLALSIANSITTRVIECSLLEAQAAQAAGDDHRAKSALERALASAQPEGFVRIFDQGPVLTRLLVEAANHGIHSDDIARVLAALGGSENLNLEREGSAASLDMRVHLEYGEHLSERELEVLRLVAQGSSNQAIAGQLVITVGTVKSHINHILGKLDVHNRTEAVARARGLGLLGI